MIAILYAVGFTESNKGQIVQLHYFKSKVLFLNHFMRQIHLPTPIT